MGKIVVSQPMFLPWHGLIEQVLLSDIFVHYDDALMPNGRSFMNRVQIKNERGISWLTAPVTSVANQLIKDVKFAENSHWRKKHLATLRQTYQKAPYGLELMGLLENIYSNESEFLSEFNIAALEKICSYLGISRQFVRSSVACPSTKHSTERLVELVSSFKGKTYITGHGAKNYMRFELFESQNIAVEFMAYDRLAWPQMGGEFTPYVSVLDLISAVGSDSMKYFKSSTVGWREFCGG